MEHTTAIRKAIEARLAEVKTEIAALTAAKRALTGAKRAGRRPKVRA